MRRAELSFLIVVLISSGCSKEEPPVPPAPPPPPAKPAPPEPPLPAPGDVAFRDWSDVDDEKFLALPAPAAPTGLKWDFTPGKRHGYDFSESLSQRMEREAGGKRALNTGRERNGGVFEFAAGRDRTALAMSKIRTQEGFMNDQPIAREAFAKKPLSVSECVVTEDGAVESKAGKGLVDARMYFQSLFALQPGTHELKPGKITTRLAGYFKVERYECARLESEFEISSDKPSERLLMRGRVIGYFALAERKFIRASAGVATASRGNAQTAQGVWITSSLDAVTTYRVKFLESP
jgi:hypothetical protein